MIRPRDSDTQELSRFTLMLRRQDKNRDVEVIPGNSLKTGSIPVDSLAAGLE